MSPLKPCERCGGTEFYKAVVYAGGVTGSLLPIGLLHGPRYDNIICGKCGHIEWFVSAEHLSHLRDSLERVA